MTDHTTTRHTDQPLTSEDLAICDRVFQSICLLKDARKSSEEENRIAAITIELFRQGVRNEQHLKDMVGVARGAIFTPGMSAESIKDGGTVEAR